MSLYVCEGIVEAPSLHKELLTAIADPTVQTIAWDASALQEFDASFLQLLLAGYRWADENSSTFQLTGASHEVETGMGQAGVQVR